MTVRDYEALATRLQAAVASVSPPLKLRVYGQQATPEGAEPQEVYDLFLVDVPARTRAPRFSVLLNGGTHGDEPAGAEALVRFLEERRDTRWPDVAFTITPCTNPWGYAHDTREGPGGADLNRSFRRATRRTPQVTLYKQAMRRRTFDLLVDCHEDVDTPGLYVFAPTALGQAIVRAVRPLGPVHEGDLVDGEIPLNGSVVELDSERMRERQRSWNTWPLPFYVGRYHRRGASGIDFAINSATVETPVTLPMEQRIAMHLAAIDAALATLSDK